MLGEERIDQADALRFRETIRTEIGEKVLLRLFLLIFIAFVFTVFATHRMVARFDTWRRTLKPVCAGSLRSRSAYGKRDEFQDLAKLTNEALLENSGVRVMR